jgi:hypothetical protein
MTGPSAQRPQRYQASLALFAVGIAFIIAGVRGATFTATLDALREGRLPPKQ